MTVENRIACAFGAGDARWALSADQLTDRAPDIGGQRLRREAGGQCAAPTTDVDGTVRQRPGEHGLAAGLIVRQSGVGLSNRLHQSAERR